MITQFPGAGSSSGGTNTGGILFGKGAPSAAIGRDGDTYIDQQNPSLYGPKTSGMWPSPIPLGGATVVSRMNSTGPIAVTQPGTQTINLPVVNPAYAELYYNGQLQPESLFSISGNVVTISASLGAVPPNDTLEMTYETVSYSNPDANNIPVDETPSGTINGFNTIFTLSYAPIVNTLNIYSNGQRIDVDEYTLSGTKLTLNLAPDKKLRATYRR